MAQTGGLWASISGCFACSTQHQRAVKQQVTAAGDLKHSASNILSEQQPEPDAREHKDLLDGRTVEEPKDPLFLPFKSLQFSSELISKDLYKSVFKGSLDGAPVAIVKPCAAGVACAAPLLKELGQHPNIMQSKGWTCCGASGDEYLVMELSRLGSLHHLLLSHGSMLSKRVKLTICQQVCNAMIELTRSGGLLHGCLSARNVVVFSLQPVQAKVCYLGQSCFKKVTSKEGQLPARCTPPELLREATASESKYTEKSDVWQYGMLLWEVMTNGMEPYKGKKDEEVSAAVLAGGIPPSPHGCPPEFYEIMCSCWSLEPASRPTFQMLHRVLEDLYNETVSPVSWDGRLPDFSAGGSNASQPAPTSFDMSDKHNRAAVAPPAPVSFDVCSRGRTQPVLVQHPAYGGRGIAPIMPQQAYAPQPQPAAAVVGQAAVHTQPPAVGHPPLPSSQALSGLPPYMQPWHVQQHIQPAPATAFAAAAGSPRHSNNRITLPVELVGQGSWQSGHDAQVMRYFSLPPEQGSALGSSRGYVTGLSTGAPGRLSPNHSLRGTAAGDPSSVMLQPHGSVISAAPPLPAHNSAARSSSMSGAYAPAAMPAHMAGAVPTPMAAGYPTSLSAMAPVSSSAMPPSLPVGPAAPFPMPPAPTSLQGTFPTSGTMPMQTSATIPVLVPMGPGLPMEWRQVTLPVVAMPVPQLNLPPGHMAQLSQMPDAGSLPAPRSFSSMSTQVQAMSPYPLPPAPVSVNDSVTLGMHTGAYPPPAAWAMSAQTGAMYATSTAQQQGGVYRAGAAPTSAGLLPIAEHSYAVAQHRAGPNPPHNHPVLGATQVTSNQAANPAGSHNTR